MVLKDTEADYVHCPHNNIKKIYGALMSIHVAVGLVPVKRFDHESLHQFGRNVLLESDLQLRECSSTLHKSATQCT